MVQKATNYMSRGAKPLDLQLIKESIDSVNNGLNKLVDAIHLQAGRLDDQDAKIKQIEVSIKSLQGNPEAQAMLWKGIAVSTIAILCVITLVALVSK